MDAIVGLNLELEVMKREGNGFGGGEDALPLYSPVEEEPERVLPGYEELFGEMGVVRTE